MNVIGILVAVILTVIFSSIFIQILRAAGLRMHMPSIRSPWRTVGILFTLLLFSAVVWLFGGSIIKFFMNLNYHLLGSYMIPSIFVLLALLTCFERTRIAGVIGLTLGLVLFVGPWVANQTLSEIEYHAAKSTDASTDIEKVPTFEERRARARVETRTVPVRATAPTRPAVQAVAAQPKPNDCSGGYAELNLPGCFQIQLNKGGGRYKMPTADFTSGVTENLPEINHFEVCWVHAATKNPSPVQHDFNLDNELFVSTTDDVQVRFFQMRRDAPTFTGPDGTSYKC